LGRREETMGRCVNEKCKEDPFDKPNAIVVSIDGDFACDEKCKAEYEKQKKHFFDVTCHSEELTRKYLLGED